VPALTLLAIALVLIATVAALVMYERHLLRQRIFLLLRWIDASLLGNGHITGLNWLSACEVDVPIRLRSTLFRNARFHLRSEQHPFFGRILRPFRKHRETTIDFLADLDAMPSFAVEMQTMRWFARSRPGLNATSAGWAFTTSPPIVLTTKLEWQREIACALQALLASDHREGVRLAFQPHSPHFRAGFDIEEAELETSYRGVLQSLISVAEGASQKAS
jgi:hypothetical protein